MDFFKQKSVGIEISHAGVRAVLMRGPASAPTIDSASFRPFSHDMLRISHRELHIMNPDLFGRLVQEAWSALDVSDPRISLSLPDATGRIMLLDMEERWKSKSEAVDMIRWKLKKSLPLEMSDLHLDFQVLERREQGDTSIMAAIVSRRVLQQYEDVFDKIGLQADNISFTTINILKAFNETVTRDSNAAFFSFYDSCLGVMIFSEGVPTFYRSKSLPATSASSSRVYMEVNNSLVAYRQRWPDRITGRIFCLAPPDSAEEFAAMAAEVAGQEAAQLDIRHLVQSGNLAPSDKAALFQFTAAIGAAAGRL
jgi:type IV pilus assembly protein PilM